MNESQVRALFLLANIDILDLVQIENQYWPDTSFYAHIREKSPWWRVQTKSGYVVIGWRKRVIEISWRDTLVRMLITDDDVTKESDLVHAWSFSKALEYLSAWARASDQLR